VSRLGFFSGVEQRVTNWTVNVVHLGFQPSEIERLKYYELKFYGSECHDIIQSVYENQVREIKKKVGG
jgi:hypothetical protein